MVEFQGHKQLRHQQLWEYELVGRRETNVTTWQFIHYIFWQGENGIPNIWRLKSGVYLTRKRLGWRMLASRVFAWTFLSVAQKKKVADKGKCYWIPGKTTDLNCRTSDFCVDPSFCCMSTATARHRIDIQQQLLLILMMMMMMMILYLSNECRLQQ